MNILPAHKSQEKNGALNINIHRSWDTSQNDYADLQKSVRKSCVSLGITHIEHNIWVIQHPHTESAVKSMHARNYARM